MKAKRFKGEDEARLKGWHQYCVLTVSKNISELLKSAAM